MAGSKTKSKSKSKKKKSLSKLRNALAAKQKRTFIARRIETAANVGPDKVENVSNNYRSTYQSEPLVNSAIREARNIESLFYGINAIRYRDGNEQKIIIESLGKILDPDYGMVDRIGGIVERADFKGEAPVQVFLPVPGGEKEARELREKLDDADPEISRMVTFIRSVDRSAPPDQMQNDDVDVGGIDVVNDASAYISRKSIVIDSKTLTEKMGEDPKKNIAFIKRSEKYKTVLKRLDQYHAKVDEYKSMLDKVSDDGELYANYSMQMRDATQNLVEAIDAYTASSRTKDKDISVKDAKKDIMQTLKDQLAATHQERPFIDPDNQEGRSIRPVNRDLESARMDYWVKNYNPLLESQKLNIKGSKLGEGASGAVYSTMFASGQITNTNLPAIFEAGIKMDNIDGSNPEGIASGIPEKNPEQSKRSVASFAINRLMGMDVIPRTEFTMQTDKNGDTQFGQALGVVRGIDGQVEVFDAPLPVATATDLIDFAKQGQTPPPNIRLNFENGTATPFRNVIVKVDEKNPTIQKGLSDLQVLDNVIGHADRHPGNFIYEMDSAADNTIIGVKGIDNDDTFGEDWGPSGADTKFGSKTPGLPPIIDINTAIRILELDEKSVLEVTRNLSNKLTDKELETTIVRLIAVKEAIEKKILRGEFAASPGEIIPDGTLSILAKHTGSGIVSLRRDLKTWGPQVAAEHKEENSYLGHVKARIEVAEGRGEDLPPPVYKQFDE